MVPRILYATTDCPPCGLNSSRFSSFVHIKMEVDQVDDLDGLIGAFVDRKQAEADERASKEASDIAKRSEAEAKMKVFTLALEPIARQLEDSGCSASIHGPSSGLERPSVELRFRPPGVARASTLSFVPRGTNVEVRWSINWRGGSASGGALQAPTMSLDEIDTNWVTARVTEFVTKVLKEN